MEFVATPLLGLGVLDVWTGGLAVLAYLVIVNASKFVLPPLKLLLNWMYEEILPFVPDKPSLLFSSSAHLEETLFESESKHPIIEGTEKCVLWHQEQEQEQGEGEEAEAEEEVKILGNPSKALSLPKRKISVVYIHGWGSSRQDVSPLPENIAKALGAHLFCARLSGHGHTDTPQGVPGEALLTHATASAIYRDALEAFEIGRLLGEKVCLVGFSTGGVLATWLAQHPRLRQDLSSLVLVSPAFALAHPFFDVLKLVNASLRWLPFGFVLRKIIVHGVLGRERRNDIPEDNKEGRKFWTCSYPTASLMNLCDVLWQADSIDFGAVQAPVCMLGNPCDYAVSFSAMMQRFNQLGSTNKMFFSLADSPDTHVCISRILSPASVEPCTRTVTQFLRTYAWGLPKSCRAQ